MIKEDEKNHQPFEISAPTQRRKEYWKIAVSVSLPRITLLAWHPNTLKPLERQCWSCCHWICMYATPFGKFWDCNSDWSIATFLCRPCRLLSVLFLTSKGSCTSQHNIRYSRKLQPYVNTMEDTNFHKSLWHIVSETSIPVPQCTTVYSWPLLNIRGIYSAGDVGYIVLQQWEQNPV